MQAFHNDTKLKRALLAEVKKHRLADEIISGSYGITEDGKFKACAVGCSIESLNRLQGKTYSTADHESYPALVGVPAWLARLQDTIFEGLTNADQQLWPERFWRAIPVGADLKKIKAPFLIFVLEEALTTFDHTQHPDVERVIRVVIDLYRNDGAGEDFVAAAEAAEAAWAAGAAGAAEAAAYKKFAAKLLSIMRKA